MIKRGTVLKGIGILGLIVNMILILFSVSELLTYKETDAQIIKSEMKTFPIHVVKYNDVPVSLVRYTVDGTEYEVTIIGELDPDENGRCQIRYKPAVPSVFLDPQKKASVKSFHMITIPLSLFCILSGWLLDREDGYDLFGRPID